MLELRDVRKSYSTAGFTQVALDDVSISFRSNEFVAILGPSGSGKTTMLNIIGGLDRADSGELVIEGVPTARYKDRDWDTYRNNRIGFVFQSYNLIPHQTVLANVELALTLSGVNRAERHRRAVEALERVGLGDHIRKRPNQLSGGQMQRVAIARALINDPEILLADEPTGALDSKTSVQIMALLTEIARDRLVVMVTHNPELAERYATRIVNLRDGRVAADSDPYHPQPTDEREEKTRRTSMSFLTAIALSFNNLMTKKGRTLMTSFAGSIGIIGIAAILALANGVNQYIKSVEEDTLSVYPLTIMSQSVDMTSLLLTSSLDDSDDDDGDDGPPGGRVQERRAVGRMFSSIGSNDLAALKEYLDDNGGDIDSYANHIGYSYNVTPQIYLERDDGRVRQVNPDNSFSALGFGPRGSSGSSTLLASSMSTNVFSEMMGDPSLVEGQYDVVAGGWPDDYNEVVVVLGPNGTLTDFVLYAMGLRDHAELDKMVEQLLNNEAVDVPTDTKTFSYAQLMDVTFKLVDSADYFVRSDEYGVWTDKSGEQAFVQELVQDGEELRVSGVVAPKEGSTARALETGIYYTPALTRHLIDQAASKQIVEDQLADPALNVFTGRTFADEEANPEGGDFDLSTLITVDPDAITEAFTFDESKLTFDTSALDFSMPGLEIDTSAMPELQLDDMLGSLDLGSMIGDLDLQGILAGLDLEGIGEGIDFGVDEQQVTELSDRLVQGYLEYCVVNGLDPTDTATNFPVFLASPEGQAIQAEAETTFAETQEGLEELGQRFSEQLTTAIGAAVQEQVEQGAAAMQAQIQAAMSQYMQQAMASLADQISTQISDVLTTQISAAMEDAMASMAENMSAAMGIDEEAFRDAFQFNVTEEELSQLLTSMMATGQSSYDGNLATLGYADLAKPSSIDIYPIDFESKSRIIDILNDYNEQMRAAGDEDKVITFTDLVGALMSSVTDIINVISYVLTAFVAISLVVSSIMIGVITYISVLERKKEIGILRSIGASKRDIRRVFNAETLIVGFVAGVLGIAITLLLTIPANAIVKASYGIDRVAQLPWLAAVILVAISMFLTFLAGLIPSSAASRRDPVEALRSE